MNHLIGAHLSTSKGFHNAIKSAAQINANCLQIFTKSNRQWGCKLICPEQAQIFKDHWKKENLKYIVAHASYLINLASEKPDIAIKSTEALKEELERCAILGIGHLVLHPGNRGCLTEADALKQVADNINSVLQQTSATSILLENMAGQGSSIAHRFESIAQIHNLIEDKSRVGVCFDTRHAFAAGYNLNNEYNQIWQYFDKIIGLEHLKLIHLNDSKKALGSKLDRHEKIGKGQINLATFQKIISDSRFSLVPKILETPIIESETEYKEEIELLKTLFKNN